MPEAPGEPGEAGHRERCDSCGSFAARHMPPRQLPPQRQARAIPPTAVPRPDTDSLVRRDPGAPTAQSGHDPDRAEVHRRRIAREALRARRRSLLRLAAHAQRRHQEARGRARRQAVRAGRQRGQRHAAGRADRAPGAAGHRAGGGHQGDRQARQGPDLRAAAGGHHLHHRALPAARPGQAGHRTRAADAADAAGELHAAPAGDAAHRRARLRDHGRALSGHRPGRGAAVRRAFRRRGAQPAPAEQAQVDHCRGAEVRDHAAAGHRPLLPRPRARGLPGVRTVLQPRRRHPQELRRLVARNHQVHGRRRHGGDRGADPRCRQGTAAARHLHPLQRRRAHAPGGARVAPHLHPLRGDRRTPQCDLCL